MNKNLNSDCVLIEISSITLAEKAKRILKSNGIRSEIRRSGKGLDGCGYQLKVVGDTKRAQALISSARIPTHGSSSCWEQ